MRTSEPNSREIENSEFKNNEAKNNEAENNKADNNKAKRWSIRQADVSDVVALRELALRTFYDTFADSSNPDDMVAYMRDALSLERVRDELAMSNNLFLMLNLAGADAPEGYAKLCAGEAEPCVSGANPVELGRLYVDKDAIGKGCGSALMQAALNICAKLHGDTLWLGVWEHNHRAIAFYKRWGFEQVGTHAFMLGQDRQTDWIMQRAVSETLASRQG